MNSETQWTWDRLGALEDRFWNMAKSSPSVGPSFRPSVLEQAARELLLAQSSDWQFIISTGAAGDYAAKRFRGHCDALEDLLNAMESGDTARTDSLADVNHRADDCFPAIGTTLRAVVYER